MEEGSCQMYAVVEVDKVGCECTIKEGTYNSVG
jgi:hypothetical protein